MVGTDTAASLYVGTLRHRRFTPVAHEFRYPLFMVLVDVDRIAEAMRVSWLTSYNRWNWASFMDRDHIGGATQSMRARLSEAAALAGIDLPDGRIFLLTHLRYLGYCFNPISLFYCFDRSGHLAHVMAEVHNTFGGAHNYWLTGPSPGHAGSTFRAEAAKALYVSPFFERDLTYGFVLTHPGPHVTAHIDVWRGATRPDAAGNKAFDATLSMTARPWTASAIRWTLLRHPWMTAAVVAGIHWQAVRLWWKGVAIVPRPNQRGEYTTETPPRNAQAAGPSHAATH